MERCQRHKCPDCTFCQFCSETRCRACKKKCCPAKLSMPEQIALFEKLNPYPADPSCPVFFKPSGKEKK